jgi:hypothetical protein
MPIIPSQRLLLSTDVPGYQTNPNSFGTAQDALAEVGAKISKVTLAISDEVQRSNALDSVSQKKQERLFESEDYIALLKKSAPDGFIMGEDGKRKKNPDGTDRTLTQEYRDWSNQRYTADQEEMPNGFAQKLYRDELGSFYGDNLRKLKNDEMLAQVSAYKRNAVQSGLLLHNRLVDSPSVDTAYSGLDNATAQVHRSRAFVRPDGTPAGLLSAEEADALNRDSKDKVTEGLYQGLKNQILEAPATSRGPLIDNALQILRGQDPRSRARAGAGQDTISTILPEEKKGTYEAELLRMKKDASQRTFSELQSAYQDERVALREGRPRSQAFLDLLNQRDSSATTPDEAIHFKEQRSQIDHTLMADELVGKMSVDMRKLSPSQWGGVIDSFDSKLDATIRASAKSNPGLLAATNSNFGRASRAEAKSALEQAQSSILRERKDDAARYVISEFKNVQSALAGAGNDPAKTEQALTLLKKKEDELEIPVEDRRIITKGQSTEIARLLNTKNPEALSDSISGLQSKYGPYWGAVNEQVTKDGALLAGREDIGTLGQMKDPRALYDAASNIVNRQPINEAYEAAFPEKAVRDRLTLEVSRAVDPYVRGVLGQSRDGNSADLANRMRKMVETEAKKQKMNTPDVSESEIAARAMRIVRDYSIVDSPKAQFIVPSRDGNLNIDKRVVEAFARTHTDPEALETMKINVPRVMPNQPDYAGMPADQQKSLYFRTIQERGFWRNDPSGFGIMLYTLNDDGTAAMVRHQDGSPVAPRFREIAKSQDQFTNKALGPGMLERMGEAIIRPAVKESQKGRKAVVDSLGNANVPPSY